MVECFKTSDLDSCDTARKVINYCIKKFITAKNF